MEAYSTTTVHKKERVEYWQDLCSRTYADLAPRDHRNFEGELRRSFAGPFSFAKVSSSAACVTRSEAHVTDSSSDRFEVFLTLRGDTVSLHNGQRAVLRQPARAVCRSAPTSKRTCAIDPGLWPSSTRFDAGQGLRLVVQGSEINKYPKASAHVYFRHEDTVNRGVHVIHTGAQCDSYLLVPTVS
jgi:hypothetical protein